MSKSTIKKKRKKNAAKKAPARKIAGPKSKSNSKDANKSARKKTAKYVLMPGGLRLASKVKLARKKGKFRVANGKLLIGKRKRSLKSLALESTEVGLLEAINPHWVATAGFDNNSGKPIVSFRANLQVPEKPTDKKSQLIFFFIGLQGSGLILQPILQWGFSQMGGGLFWSIGSCVADLTSNIQSTQLTRVNPGQSLTAFIRVLSSAGNQFRYSCGFEGFDDTRLDTPLMPELKNHCVTLESYRLTARSEYPPEKFLSFLDLRLADSTQVIIPPWHADSNPGPIGEFAVLRRVPGSSDKIELHYSDV